MTTSEDARKALQAFIRTDETDDAAVTANTKSVICAYAQHAHDVLFGDGIAPIENIFVVAGALIAARGMRDTLDDTEIDFVDRIVASTAAVVTKVEKEMKK